MGLTANRAKFGDRDAGPGARYVPVVADIGVDDGRTYEDALETNDSLIFPDGRVWSAASLVIHSILVLKARWPEVEHIIKRDKYSWSVYESAVIRKP